MAVVTLLLTSTNYKFPSKIEYGKGRSFQHAWLQEFPWLSYSESLNGGFCNVGLREVFCVCSGQQGFIIETDHTPLIPLLGSKNQDSQECFDFACIWQGLTTPSSMSLVSCSTWRPCSFPSTNGIN